MHDLNDSIRRFLSEEVLSEEELTSVAGDTPLITSGLLSSIAVLSLVAFLEDELEIELEAHEISPDTMNTLDDIVALAKSKQENLA